MEEAYLIPNAGGLDPPDGPSAPNDESFFAGVHDFVRRPVSPFVVPVSTAPRQLQMAASPLLLPFPMLSLASPQMFQPDSLIEPALLDGDDSNAWARARVGAVLNGKWRLERLLGVGGMGAVYAGLHRNGARAAVKVLHRSLAKHAEVRARFLREGYAANRVAHPNVVKVLDDDVVEGGKDDGTAYLVMELLEGESLESWAGRGLALGERDFLMLADVVLEVLEVAHQGGVVHRDIKPDNLFVTRGGVGRERIKVLDFGLARLLEGRAMTVHGIALGSPAFMSPEQATGGEIDGRTDLFALAASGFRLITGRRIHEGSSSIDVVLKMGKLRAPRVRTVAPQVSEALAGVLDRALEFRREERYGSARAMRADVQRALSLTSGGPPYARAPKTPGGRQSDRSIELSASDLEVMSAFEGSAAPGDRDVAPIQSILLSASDLEEVVSARPRPIAHLLPPTEPMPAVEPTLRASRAARPPSPVAVSESRPELRAQRSPLPLALVGLCVVGLGALLAAMWLREPVAEPSFTWSRPVIVSPSATTRLSPADPLGTRTAKRPKR